MRLVPGHLLSGVQRKEVLAAFLYRNTLENPQGAKHTGETLSPVSDDHWIKTHAFYIRNDGKLAKKPSYCEPYYLVS